MDLYFNWLLEIIACPENYLKLMHYLYNSTFIFTIRNDKNRAADGLELRNKFKDEYGLGAETRSGECSILEMMIALACRMEDDIMHDPGIGDRSPEWFWIMISNLKLDGMDDEHFDEVNVNSIVDVFLNRRYFMNGTGGLFPLRFPKVNQRRVEIWYQMNAFLNENY
jgi:hypothetical protein